VKRIGRFDLIICGRQAIDGDTAQVGPELAEFLDLPQATCVNKIEVCGSSLRVECEVEEGYERVEVSLPALLTVTRRIGELRSPTLKGVLSAKKKKVTRLGIKELGLPKERVGLLGSPTQVVRTFTPPPKEKRITLHWREGVVTELARKIKESLG
jgi:electron transfer flavoprotein beta subunit